MTNQGSIGSPLFLLLPLVLLIAFECYGEEPFPGKTEADIATGAGSKAGNPLQLIESHLEAGKDETYVAGTIGNTSDKQCHDVVVDVTFYDDPDSGIAASASDFVEKLHPHGVWKFKALIDVGAKKWQIQGVRGYCP